ncbi:hypothetical protein [Streptomyces sp. NBC_00344]|uniref:hypothetical protein n=1 Tax=Streptomyces sp. NBC_00344 TaxID=2975720 RepID=UPI002E1AB847
MPISAYVRLPGARTGTAVAAALAVAGFSLAGAPAAYAVPGDSGDVTVQPASRAAYGPHRAAAPVCRFVLSAANFESVPLVNWTITARPPSPITATLTGAISLVDGKGRTEEYSLPDGTYVLNWTFPGGLSKQKTFEVDCSHQGANGQEARGKPWSPGGQEHSSSWAGPEHRPDGAVHAGGGGVPTAESSTAGGSAAGVTTVLGAAAAAATGLVFVRRAARRRARGAA